MERENQEYISIVNATENNLKHVSLKIPKKKIIANKCVLIFMDEKCFNGLFDVIY